MSDFLNQLKLFEDTKQAIRRGVDDLRMQVNLHTAEDRRTIQNLRGKIVLDPRLDPDPYSLHNIPLTTRLIEMGWR
jgi:hypothetical protein